MYIPVCHLCGSIYFMSCLEPESSLVTSLQGLLVVQDIQMASLVALMPFFASSHSNDHASFISYLTSLMKLIQVNKANQCYCSMRSNNGKKYLCMLLKNLCLESAQNFYTA